MLAAKIQQHHARVWLVNTGLDGGTPGGASGCHTRAIIDAIHSGALAQAPTRPDPSRFRRCHRVSGVPAETLWAARGLDRWHRLTTRAARRSWRMLLPDELQEVRCGHEPPVVRAAGPA
jgi:ATP-dependent phosphoenolpyruvate carboxykinase